MATSKSRKLLRRLTLKFFPFEGSPYTRILRAEPGKHFTEEGVQRILEDFAAHIERVSPDYDFSLVELDPGSFNFVCRGPRPSAFPVAAAQPSA